MSQQSKVDRAIDAFIEGSLEFAQLRRALEVHLGRNPARREPAQKRLDRLKEEGRMSTALYAILTEELERSAFGDVTAMADGPEGEHHTLPIEPTIPDERTDAEEPAGPAAGPPNRAAKATGKDAAPSPSAPPAPRRADDQPSGKWAARAGTPATADLPLEGPATRPAPTASAADPAARRGPAPARPPEIGPGTVLKGRYELEALLGRGGISLVYRARDRRRAQSDPAGAHVALKLLAPEFAARPDARRALAREAAQARRLSHPNVVRVLDMDNDGELPFLVMELLAGERLRSLLVRRYPDALPRQEALSIVRDLAEALAHVHRRGVVHRDVKPANVFVSSSGEARLLDFGLAVSADDSDGPDEPAMRARTPAYASPEMLAGKPASPQDDVYSLANVAYELFTGRHPFGKLPGDEAAHRGLKPSAPDGLPAGQWKVLKSALAFRADQRPPDAGAFLEAFFAARQRSLARPWVLGAFLGGLLIGLIAAVAVAPDLIPGLADRARDWLSRPAAVQAPPAEPDAGAGEAPDQGQPAAGDAQDDAAEPAPALESVAGDVPPAPQPTPDLAPSGPVSLQGEAAPDAEPETGPDPGGDAAATPPPAASTAADEAPAEPSARTPTAPAQAGTEPARAATEPAGPATPATIALPAAELTVSESASALRITIPRPAGWQGTMRVEWRTLQGTAGDPDDYVGSGWEPATADSGPLVILIPIVSDSLPEYDEVFFVDLRTSDPALPVGEPARSRVTITDDD